MDAWLLVPVPALGDVAIGEVWLPPRPRDESNDPISMDAGLLVAVLAVVEDMIAREVRLPLSPPRDDSNEPTSIRVWLLGIGSVVVGNIRAGEVEPPTMPRDESIDAISTEDWLFVPTPTLGGTI